MKKITMSFIICSYNDKEIGKCLASITNQKFEGEIEIIVVDGGSKREVLEIIKEHAREDKRIRLIKNSEKLPEGYGRGKWLGWKKARGEFIAIVDQDNELQGKDWIRRSLLPFKDGRVFGVLSRLKVKPKDPLINQYVALQGTDPVLAYRSLDGIVNRKFDFKKQETIKIKIEKDNPYITGGNCFVYRKKYLDEAGGYIQDTLNVLEMSKTRHNIVAIPRNLFTHHKATKSLIDFIRKKRKWGREYFKAGPGKSSEKGFPYIPENKIQRREMLLELFTIAAIIPGVLFSMKKILKTGQKAWVLHPFLSFATGLIYFYSLISNPIYN